MPRISAVPLYKNNLNTAHRAQNPPIKCCNIDQQRSQSERGAIEQSANQMLSTWKRFPLNSGRYRTVDYSASTTYHHPIKCYNIDELANQNAVLLIIQPIRMISINYIIRTLRS